jgi:hypothetical protein
MEIYPSSPRELLTMMASTSTQIDVFSDGVIQSVKEGEINPLTVLIQLRAMEQASQRILKEIHENIMSEANKYPGKSFEFMGNQVTKAEHGTKYDYSACNDPILADLLEDQQIIDAKVKDRQDRLKAQTTPETMINHKTGEVVTINPPVKKSKSGLNVSIK